MNKIEEFEYSSFFIEKINKIYGKNYKAVKNEDENKIDGDVDIYGISDSSPSDKINIQCITRSGNFLKMMARQRKKIERGDTLRDEDKILHTNIKDQIKYLITKKENQYPILENLILLIINNFSYTLSKNDYLHVKEILGDYRNSMFNGIYFVNPPKAQQIIVLKSMFNDERGVL